MLPRYTEFATLAPDDAQDLNIPDALGSAAGWTVAISADGLTVAIGGPRHNGAAATLTGDGTSPGNVWVYVWDGSAYSVEAELFPGDADGGFTLFGDTLAMSADGNVLIASGVLDGAPGAQTHAGGKAWIFTRSAGVWTQTVTLSRPSGDDTEFMRFGSAVAMTRDGTRACVGDSLSGYTKIGDPQDGEFLPAWGQAYVYDFDGGWSLTAVLRPEDGDQQSPPFFGIAMSFAGDNNDVLIIGGPFNDEDPDFSGNKVGAVWVYTLSGDWAETQMLVAGNSYQFGIGVVATTNRLVITGRVSPDISPASVWVYSSVDGGYNWTFDQTLDVGVDDPQSDNSLVPALSDDGDTLLLGTGFLNQEYTSGHAGNVAVLGYTVDDGWNQTQILRPDDSGANAAFGWYVAMTPDGRRFVGGGPGYSTGRGAAWVYRNRAVAVSFDRPHFPRT